MCLKEVFIKCLMKELWGGSMGPAGILGVILNFSLLFSIKVIKSYQFNLRNTFAISLLFWITFASASDPDSLMSSPLPQLTILPSVSLQPPLPSTLHTTPDRFFLNTYDLVTIQLHHWLLNPSSQPSSSWRCNVPLRPGAKRRFLKWGLLWGVSLAHYFPSPSLQSAILETA